MRAHPFIILRIWLRKSKEVDCIGSKGVGERVADLGRFSTKRALTGLVKLANAERCKSLARILSFVQARIIYIYMHTLPRRSTEDESHGRVRTIFENIRLAFPACLPALRLRHELCHQVTLAA